MNGDEMRRERQGVVVRDLLNEIARLRAAGDQMAAALSLDTEAHLEACDSYYCCSEFCDYMSTQFAKEEAALKAWQSLDSDEGDGRG